MPEPGEPSPEPPGTGQAPPAPEPAEPVPAEQEPAEPVPAEPLAPVPAAAAPLETRVTEGRVYRVGANSRANLTPRPAQDHDGLSTHVMLENVAQAGQKAQVIDISKLKTLEAWRDPDGHVSIRPANQDDLQQWAGTREAALAGQDGPPHPLTQELLDAVVEQTKRPKAD